MRHIFFVFFLFIFACSKNPLPVPPGPGPTPPPVPIPPPKKTSFVVDDIMNIYIEGKLSKDTKVSAEEIERRVREAVKP